MDLNDWQLKTRFAIYFEKKKEKKPKEWQRNISHESVVNEEFLNGLKNETRI